MPERFPTFVRATVLLFAVLLLLTVAVPVAVELSRITYIREALDG